MKFEFPNQGPKIETAREEAHKRRDQAAREPGTLNPRGQGGPVFEEMGVLRDELGSRSEDRPGAEIIRQRFEKQMEQRCENIYQVYFQSKKGAPSPEVFRNQVKKSFLHGFDLYLKVALRLDEGNAPKPHEPYQSMVQGYGQMRIVDENDKDHYLGEYLIGGSEHVADKSDRRNAVLPREVGDHQFDPDHEFEGYEHKYAAAVRPADDSPEAMEKARRESAFGSYMFEKMRIYADDYFTMLSEAVRREVPWKTAVELSQFVYGNSADIFAEVEDSLDANTVAWQSLANRARVRVPFEKYIEKGEELEEAYPYEPGSGGWVTSPQMVRNLIFKYPHTVEVGLEIANRAVPALQEQYPGVPRKYLIDRCVGAPDTYEAEIQQFVEVAQSLMDVFPMEDRFGPESSNENVFSTYKVEGPVMNMLNRVGQKQQAVALKRSVEAFTKVLERAADDSLDLSFAARRRMLRSLLIYNNASPDSVMRRERSIASRRVGAYESLLEAAEVADPIWGSYHVDIGYGNNEKEIIDNGKAAVEMVVEQFGPEDGEDYLSNVVDLFFAYIENGFPQEPELLSALKDTLIMDPHQPDEAFKKFYPAFDWPEGVDVLTPQEI